MLYTIDLNCDMGEGIDDGSGENIDAALMNYVSSVNVACGFHAGNPTIMHQTVELAAKHGVAVGAHPGLADKENFGRKETNIGAREAYQLTLYQIGALFAFTQAAGVPLNHVKPHGALYNMAARDINLATAIAQAVFDFDQNLILYGLSGSQLILAANKIGLTVANEVFSDRTYQSDGMLSPRSEPNALITNEKEAINQVLSMVLKNQVLATNGTIIPIIAETLCIHGDGPHAFSFAKTIHQHLTQSKITIAPIKKSNLYTNLK